MSAWSALRTRHHTNYRYMMNLDETILGFYIVAPLRVDCFHLGEKLGTAEGSFQPAFFCGLAFKLSLKSCIKEHSQLQAYSGSE